jgi:hypothetical protein
MASLSAKKSSTNPNANTVLYKPTLKLLPALSNISEYRIKAANNAGANDTKGCREAVRKLVNDPGLEGKVNVACLGGDDVLPLIQSKLSFQISKWQGMRNKKIEKGSGKGLTIFDAWVENADVGTAVGEYLKTEEMENLCIVQYAAKIEGLGVERWDCRGTGVSRGHLKRVRILLSVFSDASPIIGAAAWWHGWNRGRLEELASAFIARHLIECSSYVCGGNFTGFKGFEGEWWLDIGYPIAKIGIEGQVVITKQKGTGGIVRTETCKAQLLYEIQGPWYFTQ